MNQQSLKIKTWCVSHHGKSMNQHQINAIFFARAKEEGEVNDCFKLLQRFIRFWGVRLPWWRVDFDIFCDKFLQHQLGSKLQNKPVAPFQIWIELWWLWWRPNKNCYISSLRCIGVELVNNYVVKDTQRKYILNMNKFHQIIFFDISKNLQIFKLKIL